MKTAKKLEEARLIERARMVQFLFRILQRPQFYPILLIFSQTATTNYQRAAIELADNISDLPKKEKFLAEYISDSLN